MINTKKSPKADLEGKKSTFFLIGLVSALCFVLLAFEWKTSETKIIDDMGTSDFVTDDYVFIPRTFDKQREAPKPVVKAPSIVIVDNSVNASDDLDFLNIEPEDITPIDYPVIMQTPEEPENTELDDIIAFAEVMPEFPGGQKALLSYLSKNVKYPVIAQENGIEGKVYITFVVDEQGNIYDATIARGPDQSLNSEALRVVKSMPRWKPGMQGGKAVKVRYTVPVNFILQ